MNNGNRLKAEAAGFTLIELLVAMAVSLVVLFATLQLFENSQRSYSVQEEVAETQQNVRIAKMFLEREIRMAGAGIPDFSFGGSAVYPFEFENNADGTAGRAAALPNLVTGTDLLVVRYQNFGVAACGNDPAGAIASCDDLPPLTLVGVMPEASAEAYVNEDLDAGVGWDASCYCDGATYAASGSSVIPAIIASPDGARSEVLLLTTIQHGPDKIQNHPASFEGVPYDNKVANEFPSGSIINFFNPDGRYEAVYHIDSRAGIPCLVRNTGSGGQVIAEYIEDLQLSFGLDTTGDGTVDTTINGANLTGASTKEVRMVTLNLVGRSANPHRDAGSADGYRRRQLAVTVKVRNLGL